MVRWCEARDSMNKGPGAALGGRSLQRPKAMYSAFPAEQFRLPGGVLIITSKLLEGPTWIPRLNALPASSSHVMLSPAGISPPRQSFPIALTITA